MTTATAPTQLDHDNPWPGLESFQENAHGYFFGRDREADSLLSHVLDAPVTVLYGRSGLGKTSLLQAGLFPALRDRDHLPIYVRFGLSRDAIPLTTQVYESVLSSIHAEVPDAVLPSDEGTLWECLHRNDFELWSARNYPLVPVIVFDQFEELFTLGERIPDLVDAFRDELGDLVENRIPSELAARIANDEAVARRFNLRSRNYKVLISLREDFLPELEGWSKLIPALGRSRIRLLPLQANAALDAVRRPAAGLMTDALARRVVDIIDGEELQVGRDGALPESVASADDGGTTEVEPALLSLFCRELNEERKRRGKARFDEGLVEDAKQDILSNYYLSCVSELPSRVAEFIEAELITEKGFRDNYIREDAVPSHLTEDELAQLISARLLRLEDRYGAQRIELTHDVLTGVVRDHRDRRRADEEKAALAAHAEQEKHDLEEAAAQREAELARERRVARRLRWLSAAMALVCVIAVVLALWAWRATAKADEASRLAGDRLRDATAQRLYGESVLVLDGLGPGRSDDVLGIQESLAAFTIPSNHHGETYPLFTSMAQTRDLVKIIDGTAEVISATFSPDGTRIASAGTDDAVRLWDAASGQPIGRPLRGHTDWTRAAAFSPDGTRIASASADETVRLWDAATGQPIGKPLMHPRYVNDVAFSPDGRRIATACADDMVRIWDAATGNQIGEPLRGHEDWVRAVAFSPDGRRIASAGDDKTVRMWDTATGKQIGAPLLGHTEYVRDVAFSPDGSRIASVSDDKTVRMWDTATGKQIGPPMLGHVDAVYGVAFSPDGSRIASAGADKTVRMWNTADGRQVGEPLSGHDDSVTSVAFSPNGQRLVSTSDDRTVRVWDVVSWQPMLGHVGTVVNTAYSHDGRELMSGSADGTIRVWDSVTGRPIGRPKRVGSEKLVSVSPIDEDRLLSVENDNTVQLWNAHTLAKMGDPLPIPPAILIAWNDDAHLWAAQTDLDTVQVWDARSMRRAYGPIRQEASISTMILSDDGRLLATGGYDGSVRLWDTSTGKPIGGPLNDVSDKTENRGVTRLAISHDGRLLAASLSNQRVRLWDTHTLQPVGHPIDLDETVLITAFSPDGRTLAFGSVDGSIRLWNVSDQSQLSAPLKGHSGMISSLEFSPDGTRLASGSSDNTLRMWPVPAATADGLCAKLTHNMSHQQWNEVVSPDIPYVDACPDLPDADDAG